MLFPGRSRPGPRCRPLALEPRLLFDGAGFATAGQVADTGPAPSVSGPSDSGVATDASAEPAGRGPADTSDRSVVFDAASGPDASEPVRIEIHKGVFGDAEALDAALVAGADVVGSADVGGVDAGDTVHYAITVVNSGTDSAFDLQVQDRLPPAFDLSMVRDLRLIGGDGEPVDFSAGNLLRNATTGEAIGTGDAFALALFCGDAVEFVDPGHGQGYLGGRCDTDRASQVTIAYSVTLPVSVVAAETVVNRASAIHAAASECGPNLVSDCDPPSDPATVTIDGAHLTTRLIATDQSHTDAAEAVIGEILTYETVITLPEGTSPSAVLTQQLAPGLSLVAIDRIVASDGVESGAEPDPSTIRPEDADGGIANRFVIDFGDIVNRNRDDCAADTITVVYRAVVANVLANQQGESRVSDAAYQSGSGAPFADCSDAGPLVDLTAQAEAVTVVEPVLTVSVTPDGGPVVAGGRAEFVVTIRNDSDVDAFDVRVDDLVMPAGLALTAGGVALPALPVLRAGEQAVWRFSADVATDATVGGPLSVDVAVRFSSIPNDTDYAAGYPPGTGPDNLSPFVAGSDRERTGVDGPVGLDDYFATDSGSVVADAAAPPPSPPPPAPPPGPGPGPVPVEPPAPGPAAGPPGPGDDRPPSPPSLPGDGPIEPLPPLAFANPFGSDLPVPDTAPIVFPPIVAGDKAIIPEPPVGKDDDCIPIRPKVVKKADAPPKPAARSVFAEGVAKVEKRAVTEPTVPVKKRIVPAVVKPRPAPAC